LLGVAAPRKLLDDLSRPELILGPTEGLPFTYRLRALTLSHTLWAVSRALQHANLVYDLSDRRDLLVRCSGIVDPVQPLFEEDDALLREQTRRLTDVAAELSVQAPSDTMAFLKGRALSLVDLASRMLDDLGSGFVGGFAHYRVMFEAYTGLDCSHFYQEHHLRNLSAAATLEDFRENYDAAQYEPGVRYFFGHRIPD
jgi:hypothetical protein